MTYLQLCSRDLAKRFIHALFLTDDSLYTCVPAILDWLNVAGFVIGLEVEHFTLLTNDLLTPVFSRF